MDLSGHLIKGTGSYVIGEIAPPSASGELITNGGLDDSTGWNPTTGWTISGGAAHYDDVTNFASLHSPTGIGMVSGRFYKLSFDILNTTGARLAMVDDAGSGTFGLPSTNLFAITHTNGHYDYYFQASQDVDQIEIVGYTAGSTFSFDNFSIQEVPEGYPLLDKGAKYLECTVAGTVAFPSDQAYGEWEFDYYKAGISNIMITSDIIGDRTEVEGYILNFGNNEQVRMYTGNPGAALSTEFLTGDDYIELYTWYRIKITATLNGEFYTYIMGGTFGSNDWTLIDASGGSGVNPFTDTTYNKSTYFVLDFDSGDRIRNITMRKAVQQ